MPTPLQLRNDLAELAVLANADLDELWRLVSTAVEAREALMDILPALIETYGEAAAALAADWYDELREEDEIRGRFRAITAESTSLGAEALAGWALAPYVDLDEIDWDAAAQRVTGGMERRLANVARETITVSSLADPGADGWQRVARAGGCAFCRMLAGRGTVYTERGADFASHDNCHCVATVAWSGRVKPIQPYAPSLRDSTEADRARVRAWIKANP